MWDRLVDERLAILDTLYRRAVARAMPPHAGGYSRGTTLPRRSLLVGFGLRAFDFQPSVVGQI